VAATLYVATMPLRGMLAPFAALAGVVALLIALFAAELLTYVGE
jgi:hypothetical protein